MYVGYHVIYIFFFFFFFLQYETDACTQPSRTETKTQVTIENEVILFIYSLMNLFIGYHF